MTKIVNLNEIWQKQKEFQYHFYDPDALAEDTRVALTKEYILCIHRELGEVLNNTPWKLHRANNAIYDIPHAQEELIDCFKFLINLCILQGMTPESFKQLFFKKSKIVEQRYQDEIVEPSKNGQLTLPFNNE